MIESAQAAENAFSRQHLVRVGAGHVGRFTAVDAVRYPRHSRVVVRTPRGLELGEVLAPPDGSPEGDTADGSIVRGVTAEDELLAARLQHHRDAAYEACARRLAELRLPTVLMDVEHLFDGRTLVFYFLGEVTSELEALTAELAELYETHVQFRRFGQALDEGCGPGCGSEAAEGCKTCATGSRDRVGLLDTRPSRLIGYPRLMFNCGGRSGCLPGGPSSACDRGWSPRPAGRRRARHRPTAG